MQSFCTTIRRQPGILDLIVALLGPPTQPYSKTTLGHNRPRRREEKGLFPTLKSAIHDAQLFRNHSVKLRQAFTEKLDGVTISLQMNSRIILALFFFASLLSATVLAAENSATVTDKSESKPWIRKVAFGVLLHDIGFISDHKEKGVDPNWEIEFNRPEWRWWRWVGSPYWMIGATPNFIGDTSAFYFGHTWEISLSNNFLDNLTNDFTKRVWVAGGVSTAIHTGPLKTDEAKCKHEGDCGFGSRVLPRISLEIGANFWGNHAVSLFFDHMSHGSLGCSCIQNEGVDHTGIRYHFTFDTGKP